MTTIRREDENAKRTSSVDAHHQEMVKVKFVVPNGVVPGQKILVNTPDGHQISVIIPRLAKPGTTITVMVPKRDPVSLELCDKSYATATGDRVAKQGG